MPPALSSSRTQSTSAAPWSGAPRKSVLTTASSHYASGHAVPVSSAAALTHGFQVGFYTLTGVALAGAAMAAVFIESKPKAASTVEAVEAEVALEEAA